MKFKLIYTLLLTFVIFHSCTEVNITKELSYAQLLDSAISTRMEQVGELNKLPIDNYIQIAKQRPIQISKSSIPSFQKQWLYNELQAYKTNAQSLEQAKSNLDILSKELILAKTQVQNLKADLIHRNISKQQFSEYFSQEQDVLAGLEKKLSLINKTINDHIKKIDVLEKELSKIIEQLQANDNEKL